MADRLTRSGNPGLNDKTFTSQPLALPGERMTLQGAINKSFVLLVVLLATALYPWSQYFAGDTAVVGTSVLVGLLGGFVLGLIISFKPAAAPYLAIPYAACEGLALGAISAELEHRFPGIAIQAVGLTFCVLGAMLALYTLRIIRATERLRAVVITGTAALAIFYVVTLVLQAFFHVNTSLVMGSSPLSIGISLLAIGLAAMYLILDFDLIESGAARGVPRYMEWYAAFGLLMTLVWLYLEILRLLQNTRRS
ncbi:MAG TPA: Bax inhibitor-1/YccA family protein [Steroidobacteraceae bacterium]|nr:Bax inhibitor-1/YccA family protein [Steroidobacteraceae bacterium]